jgi:hypothetical protein
MSLQDGELIKKISITTSEKIFYSNVRKVTKIRINRNARSKDFVVTANDSK